MRIFYIMGGARTGKDTFREVFENHFNTKQISVVDRVKEIAKECFDWDGKKDEKGRQLLSDLKDAWDKYNEGTIKNVGKWLDSLDKTQVEVVFIQVREYHSIKRMKELYGGEVIRVTRGEENSDVEKKKLSEFPEDWEPDYDFKNDGTLEEFKKDVLLFINFLKKEIKEGFNEWKCRTMIPHVNTDLNVQIPTQNYIFSDFFFLRKKYFFYIGGSVKENEYRKKVAMHKFENAVPIDPLDYDYKKIKCFDDIIQKDLVLIDKCDFLVAYLKDYTAGTLMEIMYARTQNKPVFLIIENEDMLKDVWIIGNASKVFFSVEECLEFIDN